VLAILALFFVLQRRALQAPFFSDDYIFF